MTFYSIKQLADLSGISTRTLRFYDAIELFKPALIGENQYRYYKESQLVDLQQILFFKALGLSLSEIKALLMKDDYNQIETLVENRNKLIEKVRHLNTLIQTCQKTIQHCRGEFIMNNKALFSDFDAEKQQEYEDYLSQRGLSQDDIDDSWRVVAKRTEDESERLHQLCRDITQRLALAIRAGKKPTDEAVQNLIDEHYQWVCHHWTPNQETYLGLAAMYQEDNEFNQFYQSYHPGMVAFLSEAMKAYANEKLSE